MLTDEQKVILQAVSDHINEHFAHNGEARLPLPNVEVKNEILPPDNTSLVQMFAEVMATVTAEMARLSQAPAVTVEAPVTVASPAVELKHHYEVQSGPVNVDLDVEALVMAVKENTQVCRDMFSDILSCLKEIGRTMAANKPSAPDLEIVRDNDGKMIGLRSRRK